MIDDVCVIDSRVFSKYVLVNSLAAGPSVYFLQGAIHRLWKKSSQCSEKWSNLVQDFSGCGGLM